MSTIKPLWAHQKETIKRLDKSKRLLDFSDPGTGKSRSHLEAFAKRRKRSGKCALILATRSILKNAWADDCDKYTPQLKTSIAYAKNRAEAFAEKADIYITNHDAVKWLAQQNKKFFDKFDTLIIDESTAYKHHTSARSRAVSKIRKYFDYREAMTGTPNSNTICDVWHQAFLIDDGQRLGTSFFAFRSSVCSPTQVGPRAEMVRWEDKEGAEEVVFDRLSDITVRHRLEDCMDIPATHIHSMEYELTPKQMKTYVQMEALQVAQLDSMKVVSAINAAAVYTKLLQISSGAVYASEDKYEVIDTERYELVLDLCEERKHPIVPFQWKHQKDMLVAEATKRKLRFAVIDGTVSDKKRDEIVANYQNGWYDLLLGHPKSMAHGLTLTRGTSIIWPCPTADLEWWEQVNRRQARGEQKEKTEVLVIVAPGTREPLVYQRCMDKKKRADLLKDLFADVRAA